MARVDDILKKIADRHINNYARWLIPEPVTVVRRLESELPARRADLVYLLVTDRGESFIFHLEFQQDRSEDPMNLRMLGYDVRLREEHRLPICGTVIYLKPEADEGFDGQFVGRCPIRENREVLTFYYDETKLWELDGKALLKLGWVGTYPLLSLTHLDEPIEETLRQMVNEIKTTISPKGKEISVLPEGVERYTLTELNRRLMVRFVVTDLMALPNESVLDRA